MMAILPPSGRRLIAASATILALSGCANPPVADARDTLPTRTETTKPVTEIDPYITESSQRYHIPERWIRAVMQAESAGDDRAVSQAGAMGLMQIMPGTWAELRAIHGFGADPFDRRENILAGAAYLRAMYDRFGAPGFLAAYNVGPGRYAEHVRTGRPLPRETRRYVAALSRELGLSVAVPSQTTRIASAARWQDAPLFVSTSSAEVQQTSRTSNGQNDEAVRATTGSAIPAEINTTNLLFVSRSAGTDR